MRKQFLANVALDHGLLLEFFLTFARFEFALKAVGFVRRGRGGVEPDWRRFGQSIDLDVARQDTDCAAAIEYLMLHPPWRQVLKPTGLAWDSAIGFKRLERMDQVLDLVKRVRNNLFHGAKFNDEHHGGPGRNALLLRHSISVLQRCLQLSPATAASYDSATL